VQKIFKEFIKVLKKKDIERSNDRGGKMRSKGNLGEEGLELMGKKNGREGDICKKRKREVEGMDDKGSIQERGGIRENPAKKKQTFGRDR